MEVTPFDVGFECGIEWADQNPPTETINRIIELYKRWCGEWTEQSLSDYVQEHWKDNDNETPCSLDGMNNKNKSN